MRATLAFSVALIMTMTALGAGAQSGLDPAMVALWERTDLPVADLTVSRSWLWGPRANHILFEPYAGDSLDDGQRLVAYFDKSRMEINDPDGDPSSVWYVTNGLLALELVTGRMQLGDDEFEPAIPPEINVVGDQGAISPTYSAVGDNLDQAPHAEGELIDSKYDWFAAGPGFTGKIAWVIVDQSTDEEILAYDVRAAHYVAETNHTIAAPFWEFMNASGTVYENGQYVEGPLFQNPFQATGYPITEANWAPGGNILFQCFERRCLTYTPENPKGWQVEAGNVGQHYYAWRYEHQGSACPFEPERGFGELWRGNADVRAALRCAEPLYGDGRYSVDSAIVSSYQTFEHGTMLWTENDYGWYLERHIYVLYDDGTFDLFDDAWDDTQPFDDPTLIPPDGLYQPVAGFGKVWREEAGVRDRLGWATESETGSAGEIQPFQRGEMVWREAEDLIWVFYADFNWEVDGTWDVFEDTFEG
jgi:hypothetical protein